MVRHFIDCGVNNIQPMYACIYGIFASTLALAVEWYIFAKDELWKIN